MPQSSIHQYFDGLSRRLTVRSALVKYHKLLIIVTQLALLSLTYYMSFLLRFDFGLPLLFRNIFFITLLLVLVVKLTIFYFFKLYAGWWRYSGMSDLLNIAKAAALSSLFLFFIIHATTKSIGYPRSVLAIDMLLTILFIGGARFLVRAYTESLVSHQWGVNTLIIGAGQAGSIIVRELKNNPDVQYRPIGFVDDDGSKHGISIQGIKVLGGTKDLPQLIRKHQVSHVLITIPSATGAQMKNIIDKCRECKVDCRTLPAVKDIIRGSISVRQVRKVRMEDLVGRSAVHLDLQKIEEKLADKVVMITGAGGSIGSELARQVAKFNPLKLVLFERSENDLHKIETEFAAEYMGSATILPIIGDIQDVTRIQRVVADHRPNTVFHAAAYKHVPMMERNCFQAVNNNIFGTYNVATVAWQGGVEDFVLISSDKAVNPTNIMGVTKRVAELLILSLGEKTTRFVSVRFGNVLGSNGSVLPFFEQQIANHKPVTVTHPDAKRYFMTIPEAVMLVLQAATMGKGGEIFVLDMGEPIKISDLARNLIQLSGLEPEKDIPIVFTGLRPGEKLFEELRLDGEGIKPTTHEKIRVLDGGRVDLEQVRNWLDELAMLVDSNNVHGLITKLKEIVPEYTPSEGILSQCEADRFDRFVGYRRNRAELFKQGR
jgi:FlaA1/EpsC-like NDP-sugar epimerase